MFAVAARPAGPLVPSARSNTYEMPRMTSGSTRQYHSSADRADITMTSGSTWNANVTAAPGLVTSNGGVAPPT